MVKFQDMPYERVDMDRVTREFTKLTEKMRAAKSGEEQFALHQEYYRLYSDVSTNMTIAHIRHDVDMTDAFYEQEQKYYDEQGPKLTVLLLAYEKTLYDSPYREYLIQKIGPVAFRNIELRQKAYDGKLVPLMQEENALTTEYNKLLATARIDWQGESLNLSLLRPYLINADRRVRREAWEKLSGYFQGVTEKIDEIFDRLVQNRTKQGRLMGYDNYVPLGYFRMRRNSYGQKEVEQLRSQIKAVYVPFAEKIHDKRRRRLGLDRLSYIDNEVYFAEGNPAPSGKPDEILAQGQRMYAELSGETKEFFDVMMDGGLFDVLGRKTKRTGGYTTFLDRYKVPFVFANFNGTSGDLDVITHECGHAFQAYLSGRDPIREHAQLTMETAEIHSMSMEFFTHPWMENFFGEDASRYREMHLEDAAAFIPYGCMVDEFQHIVYENPSMTPKERKQAWRDLERVYKPHLDYEGDPFFEAGGYWQRQHHIFDNPFYYIDYVLAQICAFQYKIWMNRDYREAWESYLKLCRLSASLFYPDMLKEVGLSLPFEEGAVSELVRGLEPILL